MWKRYAIFTIAFLLFTGPGALDAWLSLYARLFGEDRQVVIDVNWYQTLFPLFGLGVLLFGIWWMRPLQSRPAEPTVHGGSSSRHRGRNWQSPARPYLAKLPQVLAQQDQQDIAKNLAFLQALLAVSEKLRTITQGAYGNSIGSIFQDIINREEARTYLRNDNLISQAARLLKADIENHQEKVRVFRQSTETLEAASLSANDVQTSCNQVHQLVLDYRCLVKEVATFLDGLRTHGLTPFWATNPWTERIHQHLANDYDRLMALVSDLRIRSPVPGLLPQDYDLGTLGGQALFP